jgi:hypothetical protein
MSPDTEHHTVLDMILFVGSSLFHGTSTNTRAIRRRETLPLAGLILKDRTVIHLRY